MDLVLLVDFFPPVTLKDGGKSFLMPHSPHGGSIVFNRAEGERTVIWEGAQGWESTAPGSGTWGFGW